MGAFSRMRYVVAANVNALIERAEDPEKLLRALIREMEDAGEDAREAAAELMAEQREIERIVQRIEHEVDEWQTRAEKAVASGRDDLARTALAARKEVEAQHETAQAELKTVAKRTAQLEEDMKTLKTKTAEAKSRLNELQQRQVTGGPQRVAPEPRLSRHERRLRDAMNRFDRLQNQVDRLEARVRSYEVGTIEASPWSEPAADNPVIEEELEALRQKVGGGQKAAKPTEEA